jgi:hypothetical protein
MGFLLDGFGPEAAGRQDMQVKTYFDQNCTAAILPVGG